MITWGVMSHDAAQCTQAADQPQHSLSAGERYNMCPAALLAVSCHSATTSLLSSVLPQQRMMAIARVYRTTAGKPVVAELNEHEAARSHVAAQHNKHV